MKEGLIRADLMGKRVNQSFRTVVSPDPSLRITEIGIPYEIVKTIVRPVLVCEYNIKELTKIVNEGKANFVLRDNGKVRINLKYALHKKGTDLLYGDIVIRNGKELEYSKNLVLREGDLIKRGTELIKPEFDVKKNFVLKIGDKVEVQAKDGDRVVINRQPTLHQGSMMAFQIRSMFGKTIRLNTSACTSYNADFDGDELNGHFPYNLDAEAELLLLGDVKNHLISSQGGRPNIVIVQDTLLASFLMTKESKPLSKEDFYQYAMRAENIDKSFIDVLQNLKHIRKVLKELNLPIKSFTTRHLFSLILPSTLKYKYKNNAVKEEPIFEIYKGVLIKGAFSKEILGKAYGSLIEVLTKEYSRETTLNFIDNVQFITNSWMIDNGFSIGFGDCIASKTKEIQSAIDKYFIEAKQAELSIYHSGIRENRINNALNKAKDIGLKIAKDALLPTNNIIQTVTCGSKGDFFNVAQITGLVSQQNVSGKRIEKVLNNGQRTLPHYPFEIDSISLEYESRGFIKNSFVKGLNPKEFWFHAATGREGVTDKSVSVIAFKLVQYTQL